MKLFIEIGSNNYDTLNYLIHEGWKGVIVEPIKRVFNQIEKYSNCFYENIAISEENGEAKFYFYDEITGWGSLNEEHNKKLSFNDKKLNIVKVKTMTFDKLCDKYNIKKIDLLKIDAESYDAKIIKSIDFSRYDVKELIFEFEHLKKEELDDVKKYLYQNNFKKVKEKDSNLYFKKDDTHNL